MARQFIQFDVKDMLHELDILERKELPYAAGVALKQAAYQIAKQLLPGDMKDVFDKPVGRTLRSIKYGVDDVTATFEVSDDRSGGQSAAEYLYPVSTDDSRSAKAAFTTQFTRGLRKTGIIGANRWAVPYMPGRGVRISSVTGNMSPGQYSQVLTALTGPNRTQGGYRHFSVPDQRSKKNTSALPEGIYRVKGDNDVQLLFTYAKQQPKTPALFDFPGYAADHAEDILPSLLTKSLRRATGR